MAMIYEKGDVCLYGVDGFLDEVEILELSKSAYCVRLDGGRGWIPLQEFHEKVYAKHGKAIYTRFLGFALRRVVITGE